MPPLDTLASIEEAPHAELQSHTSMTHSELMFAEVVLKQQEKEEREQALKREGSQLPVISKRDEKYLNAHSRIMGHRKKISQRKHIRSISSLHE